MTLNNIYLLLFFIFLFIVVLYGCSMLKKQNLNLKNKKEKNNKKIFLFVAVLFVLAAMMLNMIYAIIVTIVLIYYSWLFLESKKQKYKREIDKQILEIIRLFRSSVSSGENIFQAIDSISEQIKEPLSLEFKKISDKIKMGISLDEALKDSVLKIQNEQYKFFMDSLRLSHSTGIKMSDILSKIETTVAQKLALTTKVDVLTAQVRFSGMVISIIPFFIVFLIYFIEPETVSVLFTSFLGNIILLICVIMILSGSFVMKKIADIKL